MNSALWIASLSASGGSLYCRHRNARGPREAFKAFNLGGQLDGSLGFGGEESAGASFVRLDGSVWTTDKDGIVPALLAAEITARMGRDPGKIYRELTREFGEPFTTALRRRPPRSKRKCWRDSRHSRSGSQTGRRKNPDHPHPRAGQRGSHRRVEGGGRKRMVRGASVRDGEISTRFMRRASGERIICAASWRRPRRSSAMLWRRPRSSQRIPRPKRNS